METTPSTSASETDFMAWRTGWIDELFRRFNARYMAKWKSHFVDERSIEDWRREWIAALDKEQVTRYQAKRAMELCTEWYEWPPTAGQFVKACKTVKPPILRSCPVKTEPPQITHKGRQEGLKHLHEMAQNLFGQKEMS
jgi:hypothetical protein